MNDQAIVDGYRRSLDEKMEIRIFDSRHKFLANGKWWAFAMYDGMVVGAVSIEDQGTEWAWLNDLYIKRDFRRRGYALQLIEVACQWASSAIAAGGKTAGITCGINAENRPSIELFESCGFQWVFTYPNETTRLYSRRKGATVAPEILLINGPSLTQPKQTDQSTLW